MPALHNPDNLQCDREPRCQQASRGIWWAQLLELQGGRLALSHLRFGPPVFAMFLASDMFYKCIFQEIFGAQNGEWSCLLSVPFGEKMPPVKTKVQNRSLLHISHRQDTHTRDSISMWHSHIRSKTQVSVGIFATRWSCPQRNSLPSKKWQPLAWATTRSRWACRAQR